MIRELAVHNTAIHKLNIVKEGEQKRNYYLIIDKRNTINSCQNDKINKLFRIIPSINITISFRTFLSGNCRYK